MSSIPHFCSLLCVYSFQTLDLNLVFAHTSQALMSANQIYRVLTRFQILPSLATYDLVWVIGMILVAQNVFKMPQDMFPWGVGGRKQNARHSIQSQSTLVSSWSLLSSVDLFSAAYGLNCYGCRPYCLLASFGSVLSSPKSLLSIDSVEVIIFARQVSSDTQVT